MSWQYTSIKMLRTMLDDASCNTPDYTNQRLEDLLITSAYFLPMDINFSTTYTINVETYSISPDPSDSAQSDGSDFINFMVLKAACIADEGAFRNAALLQGVEARCGPAILKTSAYGQYLKDLLSAGPCKMYETLKNEYNFGYEGGGILRAVMSPFVSNDFSPPLGGNSHGMLDNNNPYRSRYGF